jgi:LacI family transcriptional regulator
MRDVARLAGVSAATVSRVVNNERYIRPETRAGVERAILELGFHRNEIGRTLRPGQSAETIALVIEDAGSPFWSAVIQGADEVARQHQHMLVVGSTALSFERERELLRELVGRRVDGLLVAYTPNDHRELHNDLARWVPTVFIDQAPRGVPADCVTLDNRGGTRRAMRHLLAQGYRRIAYLGGDPDLVAGSSRLAGYRQALKETGLVYAPELVRLGNRTVAAAQQATEALLSGGAGVDAVFADNNRMCVGVLHAVAADGYRVGVAGFDDLELANLLPVPVTLLVYDAVELGRHAARLLFDRIAGGAGPFQRSVHPTTIVVRGRASVQLPSTTVKRTRREAGEAPACAVSVPASADSAAASNSARACARSATAASAAAQPGAPK